MQVKDQKEATKMPTIPVSTDQIDGSTQGKQASKPGITRPLHQDVVLPLGTSLKFDDANHSFFDSANWDQQTPMQN